MKILVAGGAGFIGSITSLLLADAGYDVTILDNLSTGFESNVASLPLIKGDLLDRTTVEQAFKQHPFDLVLNFAGKILVSESVAHPFDYFQNNLLGALNLIDIASTHQVKGFIFSSSAAVYGQPNSDQPLSETSPTLPINPYGHTKLMVEELLTSYHQSHSLPWLALRYFNAAGAYQHVGDNYPEAYHVVPRFLNAATAGETLEIFGSDYPTPDGTCVRDYLHVVDIAAAHVQAVKLLLDNPKNGNRPINLGSGSGYSVRQVVTSLEQVLGIKLSTAAKPRRAGDPPTLIADISQAKELLDWQPQHDLQTILKDAHTWYQKYHGAST